MRCTTTIVLVFLTAIVSPVTSIGYSAAYLMLSRRDATTHKLVGLDELKAVADHATTIPITRLYLAFVSPTMSYFKGQASLVSVGMGAAEGGDYGFALIRDAVAKLRAGGVQVFLSMGGWDYCCYPYFYMRYSVGGYGPNTPNYWKISQYGGGNPNNCVPENQYCYVCEPESEGSSLDHFSIFPEPGSHSSWNAATAYVDQWMHQIGLHPEWHSNIIPGQKFTDPKTGIASVVPGRTEYLQQMRDPYQDLVYLASDLGVDGVDVDFEEFWHADFFKTGPDGGPWQLNQTVFKYGAIMYDVAQNIKNIQPNLLLSTAGGAVGAWQGNWWGGNLKGVWFNFAQWFPFLTTFLTSGPNAGGINVMTYDLSSNMQYHECPTDDPSSCPLDKQVAFYMRTYAQAKIDAAVGFEVSAPAYPDRTHDQSHQLPLTTSLLTSILASAPSANSSGFLWEVYKPVESSDHATASQIAQAICRRLGLPSPARCSGEFPPVGSSKNVCTPGSCNVCDACCKSYLQPQAVCDQCVASECQSKNVCSADSSKCNVCSACCKSYLEGNQVACDGCVSAQCKGDGRKLVKDGWVNRKVLLED